MSIDLFKQILEGEINPGDLTDDEFNAYMEWIQGEDPARTGFVTDRNQTQVVPPPPVYTEKADVIPSTARTIPDQKGNDPGTSYLETLGMGGGMAGMPEPEPNWVTPLLDMEISSSPDDEMTAFEKASQASPAQRLLDWISDAYSDPKTGLNWGTDDGTTGPAVASPAEMQGPPEFVGPPEAEGPPVPPGFFDAEPEGPPMPPADNVPKIDIALPGGLTDDRMSGRGERVDQIVTELQAGDAPAGGEGVSRSKFGRGIRERILDQWTDPDDEESRNRLSRAFAAGGAAILKSRGHWAHALGEGVEAGIADYDNQKEAGLAEEATRQRMNLAQAEMEMARRKEGREEREAARQRAYDLIDKERQGVVFDDAGNPIGWSREKFEEYNPKDPYSDFTDTQAGKLRLIELLKNPLISDEEKEYLERVLGGKTDDVLAALTGGA